MLALPICMFIEPCACLRSQYACLSNRVRACACMFIEPCACLRSQYACLSNRVHACAPNMHVYRTVCVLALACLSNRVRACAPNMHVYRTVCVLALACLSNRVRACACMFIEPCASCVPRFPTHGHASWRCASCGLALPMCRFVEACVSCGAHAGMRPSGLSAPCELCLEMGLVVCRPASSIALFTPPSAQSLPHTSAR